MGNAPFYQLPVWGTATASDGKSISTLDSAAMDRLVTNIWNAIFSLSGQTGAGSKIFGPVNVNSNPVTGVTNSAAPAGDEAVSYGLAQQQLMAFRQATKRVTTNYYQIQPSDGTIIVPPSPASRRLELPDPASMNGQFQPIKLLSGASSVTVVTVGQARIENEMAYSLTKSTLFQSDGTDWWALASL